MYENDETRAERDLTNLLNQEAASTAPAAPATPDVPPEPPRQDTSAGEDEGYKQRYLTLQGMMRSEREKWQTEKGQLLTKIQNLETRLTQSERIDVDENYRSPYVTDEVRQSRAYRLMAELNGQRHTEIHFESLAMTQPQPQVAPVDPYQEFFANLDRLAPQWRQLNQDQGFLTSLNQPVPYSGGKTKQMLLDQAVQSHDVATAAQFFLDYGDAQRRQPTPDALVAPSRRASPTQTASENHRGKVYTRNEWNEGWKQLELGNLSSQAALELERDLTNAPSEGRVVG